VHAQVQRECFGAVPLHGVRRESMARLRAEGVVPTLELVAEKKKPDRSVREVRAAHRGTAT
jgi:hypothetical protein